MSKTGKISWIDHQGKRVLYADYRGLKGEDLIKILEDGKEIQQAAGKDVLVITDFTGAVIDSKFVSEIKKIGTELDPDMKKAAAVGLSAVQKILYNSYIRFTGQHNKVKAFSTVEEALEWLVKD